ncbi:ATP-binding protein [Candidatus Pacearchaeota archaeon]|nr:ATP-binding protein [Candidatus Pacearchaeota archaeon]
MEIGKLNEWNPWWENKELVRELTGMHRPEYDSLVDSVEIKEITIITGVRRSGKSTIMYQMISKLLGKNIPPGQILFVNFDDQKLSQDSLDEIYETYRSNLNPDKKAYIFFDEIHKKEGWESWVRKKYDLKSKDKFIISGSCSYLLKKEYSTLLTGRNLTFEVFPLSFQEFLLFKNVEVKKENIEKGIFLEKTKILILNKFKEYLEFGGFPEIVLKEERFKLQVLKQYFDDILYKDIVDRYNLNNQKTRDLALFLITNFTGLISLRNIRNSMGIAYDSIKDYLSYFKEALLFFTLEHFSYSLKEQKSRAGKIYCIDNGLRNAVSFKFSKDEGKLAENIVFLNLREKGKEIYYWASSKEEVDFIVKNKDNSLSAINVSYTNEIDERETKALLKFRKNFKKAKEMIVITKDAEKKQQGIKFIPLWKWLLEDKNK